MSAFPRRLDTIRARPQGELAAGALRKDESLDAVWQHICKGLNALANHASLPENENGLTQTLVDELEQRSQGLPYYFQKEDMQNAHYGKSPRLDIVVKTRRAGRIVVDCIRFAGGRRFLALEAKRLPTVGTRRQREYLISDKLGAADLPAEDASGEQEDSPGERGGVARFKLGLHAKELKTVGMIGYVQSEAFDYWRTTINGWVDELIANCKPTLPWDEDDKLVQVRTSSRLVLLRSTNLRVSDNQRLTMRHIWVQLATKTAVTGKRVNQRT